MNDAVKENDILVWALFFHFIQQSAIFVFFLLCLVGGGLTLKFDDPSEVTMVTPK